MPTGNEIIANCGEAVRRLNPDVFGLGGLGATEHGKSARALGQGAPQKPASARPIRPGCTITVTITAYLELRIDPDNLAHALKPLQDAIADWIGIDDGDERVRWEYGQVETRGSTGTVVKVEV